MKKLSPKSIDFLKILGHMVLEAGCVLLLLNIPFGIIEPIPDFIPIVGNVDELAEVYLVWWSWPRLVTAIKKYRAPAPVDDDKYVDNVDYLDVKAEVIDADITSSRQTEPRVEMND